MNYTICIEGLVPLFDDGHPTFWFSVYNLHLARSMAAEIRAGGRVAWVEAL